MYYGVVNGCRFFFLFSFCFSVWGTFPCYLLHFGAKTCNLLNLIDFSMVLAGFSMVFIDLPKVSSIFP